MRDSPQKGAGMRDQDPPSRPCIQAYAEQAQIEFRPYQLMGFCTYLELSEKLEKEDIAN